MSDCGCEADEKRAGVDPAYRRALWIVVILNLGFGVIELIGGFLARSQALKADSLDFIGDGSITLVGLIALGLYVLGAALWAVWYGGTPEAEVMGAVGVAALVANAGVALMLYRFRSGDANMRSVWICSRNDAIGNVAVVLAALGVFGTGTAWPDLLVAGVIAALGISGGIQIIRQARTELGTMKSSPTGEAFAQARQG